LLQKSPAKHARLEFLSRNQAPDGRALTIDNEISMYLQKAQRVPVSLDVAEFWRNNKTDLKSIFELSKIIYSMSPTSAKSERNFSIACALLTQKRASLAPERVRKMLFIHDNFKLIPKDEISTNS
jgi:hypothetical protein